MMTFYRIGEPGVACVDLESCPVLTRDALRIDLFEPSQDEEKTVEAALGFEVPTREEMQKIEISRRLYREKDILFMTATILSPINDAFRRKPTTTRLRQDSAKDWQVQRFDFESPGKLGKRWAIALVF